MGQHFRKTVHMPKVHFSRPPPAAMGKKRACVARRTGGGRGQTHARPIAPHGGINPPHTGTRHPSAHEHGAFAKLGSWPRLSRRLMPKFDRRSLATATRDEVANRRRGLPLMWTMIDGRLDVGEYLAGVGGAA